MTRSGFTQVAKTEVLKKIEDIRKSWNTKGALPRVLSIPYIRRKIHMQPYRMMEFPDQDGCRRFFRIKDQLKKANNAIIKFLQLQLDPEDEENGIFYRALQREVNENKDVYERPN